MRVSADWCCVLLRSASVIVLFAAGDGGPRAQGQPALVADINRQPAPFRYGSAPRVLGSAGPVTLFAALQGSRYELWRTDGTPAGTWRLDPVAPLFDDREPDGGVAMDGALYFVGQDAAAGAELWRSDGAREGTSLVRDILPGPSSSLGFPPQLLAWNHVLYLIADDGEHGSQLWRSDGSRGGTWRLTGMDTRQGRVDQLVAAAGRPCFVAGGRPTSVFSSDGTSTGTVALWTGFGTPYDLTASGELLFFTVTDSSVWELWSSDGTPAGTHRAATFPRTGGPHALTPLRRGVCFAVDDEIHGDEPWFSDGSTAGTRLLGDLMPGAGSSGVIGFTRLAEQALFAAGDPLHGVELWRTDGTPSGTALVKDLEPSWPSSLPGELTVFAGAVWFAASTAAHGRELWRSDGTSAGTRLARDIAPGPGSSGPRAFTVAGGPLYFHALDPTHGRELWRTDGTEAGTVLVKDIVPGPGSPLLWPVVPLAAGSGLLLMALDDLVHGFEPWRSDGTEAGTFLLRNVATELPAGSNPRSVTAVGGRQLALFACDDGVHGDELWRSDGTAAGTSLVRDIQPGSAGSGLASFAALGDAVYFGASDGVHGHELWRSDGTAAGTQRFPPGVSDPGRPLVAGGALYVATYGSAPSLWRTDGTAAGAVLLRALVVRDMAAVGDTVFLAASTDGFNTELWRSDGTAAGTVLVKDIAPGRATSNPSGFLAVGNLLLFTAADQGFDVELWRSDGTAAGTVRVKDIWPGAPGANPRGLTRVGDTVFFSASDGEHGFELWRTQGTEASTMLVRDILPGPGSSNPFPLAALAGRLLFAANDGAHGAELWRSDGTQVGTVLVRDIQPGPRSGVVGPLFAPPGAGRAILVADDGLHGSEPWRSDGTAAGTQLLADLLPGSESALPDPPVLVGSLLMFAATNASAGRELFAAPAMAAAVAHGRGCAGGGALDAAGVPYLGNSEFALGILAAAPDAQGVLLLGGMPVESSARGACGLLLDEVVALVGGVELGHAGSGRVPLPVPSDPALAGLRLFTQLVVFAGAAAPGFSNRVDLVLADG